MDKGANAFSQWAIPSSEVAAIRQYLVFRGLSSTTKTFENEVKQDRDKHLMVEKIIDQIQSYISSHDIINLRDYWSFLEQQVFIHADPSLGSYTNRLWTGVLRIYLCHAATTARHDKLNEFFEKMASYLINGTHSDWRDWFVLPYIKNPEEKAQYALYFNRQWQDTLFLSLYNFLNIIVNNMPRPSVLDFEKGEKMIETLKEENTSLKLQIEELIKNQNVPQSAECKYADAGDWLPPIDERLLLDATENSDDFSNISQLSSNATRQPSTSSFVSMIKNFGSAPTPSPAPLSKPVAKIIPKKCAHSEQNVATNASGKAP